MTTAWSHLGAAVPAAPSLTQTYKVDRFLRDMRLQPLHHLPGGGSRARIGNRRRSLTGPAPAKRVDHRRFV